MKKKAIIALALILIAGYALAASAKTEAKMANKIVKREWCTKTRKGWYCSSEADSKIRRIQMGKWLRKSQNVHLVIQSNISNVTRACELAKKFPRMYIIQYSSPPFPVI